MRKIAFILLFALAGLARAQQATVPATARIHVCADESTGEISPYIYGQFIEYMGRCIDGGIYDPASPCWRHALATAWFLNAIIRQANIVKMANWAQMVNILAPIRTSDDASVCQTVFYPLREYRKRALGEALVTQVQADRLPGENVDVLNCVATLDRSRRTLTLCVVNVSPESVKADIRITSWQQVHQNDATILTATGLDAQNTLTDPGRNVVRMRKVPIRKSADDFTFPAESIVFLTYRF